MTPLTRQASQASGEPLGQGTAATPTARLASAAAGAAAFGGTGAAPALRQWGTAGPRVAPGVAIPPRGAAPGPPKTPPRAAPLGPPKPPPRAARPQDRAEVLQRAADANVAAIIVTGCSVASARRARDLCEGPSPVELFFTVGVHPHNAKDCGEGTLEELRALAAHEKCVAIGAEQGDRACGRGAERGCSCAAAARAVLSPVVAARPPAQALPGRRVSRAASGVGPALLAAACLPPAYLSLLAAGRPEPSLSPAVAIHPLASSR
jgi:hypothetical protein